MFIPKCRACGDDILNRKERFRDKGRVICMSDADGKIEALFNKIYSPITHVDVELNAWMRSSIGASKPAASKDRLVRKL